MRLLVQRVLSANVEVEGESVARIDKGLLVFVGFARNDDDRLFEWALQKLLHLRIFADNKGNMNNSLVEVDGELMLVSQFTLYGEVFRGRRPSFASAAPIDDARGMYERFVRQAQSQHPKTISGVFQANMQVALVNDGPVSIWVEKNNPTT